MHPLPSHALALLLLLTPALLAQPVRTDFDVRLDGLPFDNMGDFASPEGNCLGMSLLAIDNYLARKERRAAGIPDPPPLPLARRTQDGPLQAQQVASLAQLEAERRDDPAENPRRHPSQPAQVRAALERIRATGIPEVMCIFMSDGSGHATVLHGYDGSSLLIYDPNYPGELIRWPWSPSGGLGRHPKRGDDGLYSPTRFSVTPFRQHPSSKQLAAVRASCAAGAKRCVGRWFQVESALEERGAQREVVGRVRPGTEFDTYPGWRDRPLRARKAWVTAGERPVAVGEIDSQGRFRVRLPAGLAPGAPLQVVTVTGGSDPVLAGFGLVKRPTSRGSGGGSFVEALEGRSARKVVGNLDPGSRLNLRAGPGKDQAVLGKLGGGTSLEVLEVAAEWARVRTPDGRSGWVHRDYLRD